MKTPLVGITTSRLQTKYGFPAHAVAEKYVLALANAGAAPLLIPLSLPEEQLEVILARLDGVLFTGGGDIHPTQYGAPEDGLSNSIDEDRDRVELYLFRRVVDRSLPFLGICRGFQLVNVGLGGTLYADILAQRPGASRHDYFPDFPRELLAHPVSLVPGSLLQAILGADEVQVNSLHHQGLKDLAPGLAASATAPDGLIEGLEVIDHPFGVAVQWHPEWLLAHEPMRNLFMVFVNACE
jgi:putative glutamine amidotransferase